MSDLKTFVQEYEAFFGKFPGDEKNPRSLERWTAFAESCTVPLDKLMEKANEVRGRSRMRPALADLKQAEAACRDDFRASTTVECQWCDGSGWIVVLDHYDPTGPWKRTAQMGHYALPGEALGRSAVPCLCDNGKPLAAALNYPELKIREAHEWRVNFESEARLSGRNPVQYERELIAESWKRFREADAKGASQ